MRKTALTLCLLLPYFSGYWNQPDGVQAMEDAHTWTLTDTILKEQCFRYEYDSRNRMIMKQIPGSDPVYMVYDARNRLVMEQDANLRTKSLWVATKYDNLDRPDTTWLDSVPSTSYLSLLAQASTSTAFPAENITTSNILTATHYDDYTGITFPSGISGTYKGTWDNNLLPSSNTSFPYAQQPVQITATSTPVNTKDLVTWTQSKILNSNPVAFITTVNIYDEKGRVIQTQSSNITDGVNINTTQYSWTGQPLVTVSWQSKLGNQPDTSIIITKTTYDSLNRVVKKEMKLSNSKINGGIMPSTFTTISTMTYDALGQLKTKTLGNRRTSATTYSSTPLETQAYEFNIRGWLLGINRAYVRDAASTDSTIITSTIQTIAREMFTEGMTTMTTITYPNTNFFGFDLGYDKTNNDLINGKTYMAAQYTGNITGMVWKGANDRKVRKYDFTYDAANRLTGANFGQYATNGFSSSNVNYTVNNLTYDNNGNIKTMNQYGLKTGSTSSIIDQLSYNYNSGSNKLLNVIDAANDSTSTLGDFHYSGTKIATSTDYTYDANGNMISDQNKKISSISYNYLNLPYVIKVTGKGTITYYYDAAGNKLKKVTVDNTVSPAKTTVTTYIENAVYQNDTLQFFGTSEGRARPDGNAFVYDYFLKDHLGNTRMVITDDYNVASPILEATSYYPFGLQQKGIGLTASGDLHNFKNTFQKQEINEDLGVDVYEFKYRMDDPQIGRFWQVDPESDSFRYNSPYAFSEDKVTSGVELEGLEFEPLWLLNAYYSLKQRYTNSVAAAGRLAAGTSNQEESSHIGGPVGNLAKAVGTASDIVSATAPMRDVLAVTSTAASLVPIGEAGELPAAISGAKATISAIGDIAEETKSIATNVSLKEVSSAGIKTANGIEVNGFTEHGVNRAIQRGVKPTSILDAIKNPLKTGNVITDGLGRQSQRFIGKEAETVINPESGKIISVNPTSTKKAAKLIKDLNP